MITCSAGGEMSVREQNLSEIRDAVAKLCAAFPMEYWRGTDRERRYPSEFVRALTEAGSPSCLIPEGDGGAGLPLAAAPALPQEIPPSRANGPRRPPPKDTLGPAARPRSQ